MTPEIRRAAAGDAGALAAFAEGCFREAFGPDFPAGALDRLCRQVFARPVLEELLEQGVWLAEGPDGWLGYVALGRIPSPLPGLETPTLELARLYVARPWQGRGVADALLDAFLAEARARGGRSVWLQAYQGSPRALAFYRRRGFADFGPFTVTCEGLVLPHRALGRNLVGDGT